MSFSICGAFNVNLSMDNKFKFFKKKKKVSISDAVDDLNNIDLDSTPELFWTRALNKLIYLTKSEYGFICKVVEENGKKYLKNIVISNIAWNNATFDFFKKNSIIGHSLEFRNLNSLYGEVVKKEEVVISNNRSKDSRRSKHFPKGHPELRTFLGIPVIKFGKLQLVIGLANNRNKYKKNIVDDLKPLLRIIRDFENYPDF